MGRIEGRDFSVGEKSGAVPFGNCIIFVLRTLALRGDYWNKMYSFYLIVLLRDSGKRLTIRWSSVLLSKRIVIRMPKCDYPWGNDTGASHLLSHISHAIHVDTRYLFGAEI